MSTVHYHHTCNEYPSFKIEEIHRFDGYRNTFVATFGDPSTRRIYYSMKSAKKAARAAMPAPAGQRVTWSKTDPFK